MKSGFICAVVVFCHSFLPTAHAKEGFDLFSSVQLQATPVKSSGHTHQKSKKKALKSVEELEKVLLGQKNTALRAKIIQIAKENELTLAMNDWSESALKQLIRMPGRRKMKDFRVFPQALMNQFDVVPSENPTSGDSLRVQSYFFKSSLENSPRLEVVKSGTQPYTTTGTTKRKVPFLLFRLPDSLYPHDIHLGLFHPKTVALSLKALVSSTSPDYLKPFGTASELYQYLNRRAEIRVIPNLLDPPAAEPPVLFTGPFQISQSLAEFGRKKRFGFYTQAIIPQATNGSKSKFMPMRVEYQYNLGSDKNFPIYAEKKGAMNGIDQLTVQDIYLSVDTLYKAELANVSTPEARQRGVESRPDVQKIIVDFGDDRFLLTSVEILRDMVNNKLFIEDPVFDLPHRSKNFRDWLSEVKKKMFPRKESEADDWDLVLPE